MSLRLFLSDLKVLVDEHFMRSPTEKELRLREKEFKAQRQAAEEKIKTLEKAALDTQLKIHTDAMVTSLSYLKGMDDKLDRSINALSVMLDRLEMLSGSPEEYNPKPYNSRDDLLTYR